MDRYLDMWIYGYKDIYMHRYMDLYVLVFKSIHRPPLAAEWNRSTNHSLLDNTPHCHARYVKLSLNPHLLREIRQLTHGHTHTKNNGCIQY